MVPAFKEAVEECFAEGLLAVVFATETLALGINMPARSVVIEKLTKFTGEHHEQLSPGLYTQLTGRAGRRGIDEVGHAIVLWSPWVPFGDVASLAASTSFALRSAFRPTYNMAANLVRRYPADEARQLLNMSFAQYQADRAVVELEARVERRRAALDQAVQRSRCQLGDVGEYWELRRSLDADGGPDPDRDAIAAAVSALTPGSVIVVRGAPVAVLSVAYRKAGSIKTRVVDTSGECQTLQLDDFTDLPEPIGEIELPRPYAPNRRSFQNEVARSLLRARTRPARVGELPVDDPRVDALRDHPVAACPELSAHLRAHTHATRIAAELTRLQERMRRREGTLSRRFEQVLAILTARGHIEGWSLTPRGEILARCYHESDLLVTEALLVGVFDDVEPATLAGLVSTLTHEHRSRNPPPAPWFPSVDALERYQQIQALCASINVDEQNAELPLTRAPDAGFFAIAHAWAAGTDLDQLLEDSELSGGDFVRGMKQLLDLLGQVADLAPNAATARHARQAVELLRRGVVVASSTLATEPARF
jgi:ATP-dependent RNA helicase HelY